MDAEFVVIGAGIIGASIARHLAHYGASVLILEARDAGSGATGASLGMVRCYDRDPLTARLASASLPVYANYRAWTNSVRPLRQTGAVTIIGPGDVESLDKEARRLRRALGVEAHVVAGEDVILGVRTSEGAALVEPSAGWVRPRDVTRDLIAQARNDGAAMVAYRAVTEIRPDGSRLRLLTTGEAVRARVAVLALGAWITRPPRGITAPAGIRARAIQASVLRRSGSESAHATFIDLRTGGYGRPSDDGQSLVGAPLLAWGENPDTPVSADPAHHRRTVEIVTANLPWAATAPVLGTMRSRDGYGSLGSALLAPAGIPSAWFARVWSGGGIKVAMAAGWETAELLIKLRSDKHQTELT